ASDKDIWLTILGDGALTNGGMVSFKRDLAEAQMEAVRAYVVSEANK
ncbi:MAG: hypothetical protein IBJ12_14160, partial [Sphingomonadaceae bacterium]|nr:hypothetical protein [Sphingomonadaceae bacterium]